MNTYIETSSSHDYINFRKKRYNSIKIIADNEGCGQMIQGLNTQESLTILGMYTPKNKVDNTQNKQFKP